MLLCVYMPQWPGVVVGCREPGVGPCFGPERRGACACTCGRGCRGEGACWSLYTAWVLRMRYGGSTITVHVFCCGPVC